MSNNNSNNVKITAAVSATSSKNIESIAESTTKVSGPIYPWNPFQDLIDCDIVDEPIHVMAGDHTQFMPRNAPFFFDKFAIKDGNGVTLVLGVDYVLANPFQEFIKAYGRNVFGSVILINKIPNSDFKISYSTIGFPFALDEAGYAIAVANMVSNPRVAGWGQIVNVPSEFPPDPHDHNANETYDYREMMDYMFQMIQILAMQTDATTITDAFAEHIKSPLDKSGHTANKSMVALTKTPDMAAATEADLLANSSTALLTVEMGKSLLTQILNGKIPL